METAAILRSFSGVILPKQEAVFCSEKLVGVVKTTSFYRESMVRQGLLSSSVRQRRFVIPLVKASKSTAADMSDGVTAEKIAGGPSVKKSIFPNGWNLKRALIAAFENMSDGVTAEKIAGGPSVKKSIFPNGFEALVLNVCDETSIAELKLKVGAFEMHLKRDIWNPVAPISVVPGVASPATAPPIPSKPMNESASAAQPAVPQKSAPTSKSPFANVQSSKASKLAALEAAGTKSYVLVSSPAVGTFRSGRTLKGKKQPPSCKEGDMIKEGQAIGYLDQFGNELPIKSDVAGEVVKLLFEDGEAVGYGDPLVAVRPSFHGIK